MTPRFFFIEPFLFMLAPVHYTLFIFSKLSSVIGEDQATNNRLSDCLDAILTRSQEPPKSKKVQHTNARHAVLFETINLIVHMDCDADKLVRACNILGQFLQHRETNMRFVW